MNNLVRDVIYKTDYSTLSNLQRVQFISSLLDDMQVANTADVNEQADAIAYISNFILKLEKDEKADKHMKLALYRIFVMTFNQNYNTVDSYYYFPNIVEELKSIMNFFEYVVADQFLNPDNKEDFMGYLTFEKDANYLNAMQNVGLVKFLEHYIIETDPYIHFLYTLLAALRLEVSSWDNTHVQFVACLTEERKDYPV